MKKFKKIFGVLVISSVLSMSIFSNFAYTKEDSDRNICVETDINPLFEENERLPFADEIGWRYKTINRKPYRRQYNYSKSKWIGEWEKC